MTATKALRVAPPISLRERRVAQRQRAERRIEVDVGGVNEAERHGFRLIKGAKKRITPLRNH